MATLSRTQPVHKQSFGVPSVSRWMPLCGWKMDVYVKDEKLLKIYSLINIFFELEN
jgi:hypothetical protein